MKKLLAQNKKARHDYFVESDIEVGLVLQGTEVKSARAGKVSIKESYAEIKGGEVFVVGMHISPFEQAGKNNHNPVQKRKLLLHRREIAKLERAIKQQSYTLIPLSIYLNDKGLIKMLLGLCKGKKKYDKREAIAKRDSDMRIKREIRNRNS